MRRFLNHLGFLLLAIGTAQAAVPPAGAAFAPTAKERELYLLIRNDPQQQRAQVILDPRLCHAARKHAIDTQARRFFSHTNPDGVNANGRAIAEGYPLPAHFPANQNYIESMAGSVVGTPADALSLWRSSPAHANHVFGKTDFYRSEVVIGVGHAPPNRWQYHTYVFLSAPGPVGETWSFTSPPKFTLQVDDDVSLTDARPGSIFEVWRQSSLDNDPILTRAVAIGSRGSVSVGPQVRPADFFRIGYYRR